MDPRSDNSSRNDRGSGAGDAFSSDPASPRAYPTAGNCAHIEPRLEAFHDGVLDPDQMRMVAEHLADCLTCSARLRQIAEIDRLVLAAPLPAPGPVLRQRVYGAIAAAQSHSAVVAERASRATEPRQAQSRWPQHGGGSTGEQGSHRARGWLGALAIAAVALALVVIFVAIGRGPFAPAHPGATATTGRATPVTSAVPTPATHAVPGATLPAFADWRALYLDTYGSLHVVSLDGTTDLSLSGASGFEATSGQGQRYGVSPDGHVFAYIMGSKSGPLELLNFVPQSGGPAMLTNVPLVVSSGFAWSPDGKQLAAGGAFAGTGGLYLVNAATGAVTLVPHTQPGGAAQYDPDQQFFGWLDAEHVLVYTRANSGLYSLASLDVTSGATSAIAMPTNWFPTVVIRGADPYTIILPNGCQGCPNPVTGYALLDLKTGQVTELPNIERTLGNTFTLFPAVANPAAATPLLAAAPDVLQNPRASLYLADLVADNATPIASGEEPLGWTPDGKTLLVRNWQDAGTANGGPVYTTLALTPPDAQTAPVTVTHNLVTFLGFVRTAQSVVVPLPPSRLRAATTVPIASGERKLTTESRERAMRRLRGMTVLIKLAGIAGGLLLVTMLVVGCGGTAPQRTAQTAPTAMPTPPTPPQSKLTPYASPMVTTAGLTGDWTSYTDPQLGFTLRVPGGWLFDHSAPGGNLWQWHGFTPARVYEDLSVATISAPDATTRQFCATKPTTTVAGAPAVIADRAVDPAYAPNIQSIMEREFVSGGTYYSIALAANLSLGVAQQQLQPFFMTSVDSFTAPNKTTGTVKC